MSAQIVLLPVFVLAILTLALLLWSARRGTGARCGRLASRAPDRMPFPLTQGSRWPEKPAD
jgi:hypothetical protein